MVNVTTPLVSNAQESSSSSPKSREVAADKAKIANITKQLRIRLQYARLKVENGWQRRNLDEVENLVYRQISSRAASKSKATSSPSTVRFAPSSKDTLTSIASASSSPSRMICSRVQAVNMNNAPAGSSILATASRVPQDLVTDNEPLGLPSPTARSTTPPPAVSATPSTSSSVYSKDSLLSYLSTAATSPSPSPAPAPAPRTVLSPFPDKASSPALASAPAPVKNRLQTSMIVPTEALPSSSQPVYLHPPASASSLPTSAFANQSQTLSHVQQHFLRQQHDHMQPSQSHSQPASSSSLHLTPAQIQENETIQAYLALQAHAQANYLASLNIPLASSPSSSHSYLNTNTQAPGLMGPNLPTSTNLYPHAQAQAQTYPHHGFQMHQNFEFQEQRIPPQLLQEMQRLYVMRMQLLQAYPPAAQVGTAPPPSNNTSRANTSNHTDVPSSSTTTPSLPTYLAQPVRKATAATTRARARRKHNTMTGSSSWHVMQPDATAFDASVPVPPSTSVFQAKQTLHNYGPEQNGGPSSGGSMTYDSFWSTHSTMTGNWRRSGGQEPSVGPSGSGGPAVVQGSEAGREVREAMVSSESDPTVGSQG